MARFHVDRRIKKNAVHKPKRKINTTNRPRKLRLWTHKQMSSAIEAVTSGSLGVNRSALQYGVPKSTLKDRIAGRVKHGTKPGPVTYLETKEEEELVNF